MDITRYQDSVAGQDCQRLVPAAKAGGLVVVVLIKALE